MSFETVGYVTLGLFTLWAAKRFHYVYFTVRPIGLLFLLTSSLIPSKLTDIPTSGPSGFFSTLWAVKNFIFNSPDVIEQGYRQVSILSLDMYLFIDALSSIPTWHSSYIPRMDGWFLPPVPAGLLICARPVMRICPSWTMQTR